MKKTILAAVLAMAAVAASAGVTGSVKYDYDRAEGNPWQSGHTAVFGLKYDLPGSWGAVDAGFVGAQAVTRARSNVGGYEVGYSNGFSVGPVGVKARVAYRAITADLYVANVLNNPKDFGIAYRAKQDSLRLGVEGSMKVTQDLTGFVGYEHVSSDAKASATALFSGQAGKLVDSSTNRYTFGVDYALTPKLGVRAGYAVSTSQGRRSNGLTTAVSYAF